MKRYLNDKRIDNTWAVIKIADLSDDVPVLAVQEFPNKSLAEFHLVEYCLIPKSLLNTEQKVQETSESDEQIFYQVKDFMVSAMEKNMTPEECYGLLKALRYKFSREQNVQEVATQRNLIGDQGGAAGNQETIEGDGWEEKVKEAASSYADSLAEWDSPKWHKRKESFIKGADFAKSELQAQIEQLQAENLRLRAALEKIENELSGEPSEENAANAHMAAKEAINTSADNQTPLG